MKTANSGKKPSKLRRMFGSRFKAGSYSAFAAAVVIAIAVLANLAVQALPQTATQIDLTAQSLYTLSDQTRRIAYYTADMGERSQRQHTLLSDVRTALEEDQFQVWFQPQFNYTSGVLIGAEALVRWQHPTRGLVSPGEFIPLLEHSNLISQLDRIVWEKACRWVRRWSDMGLHFPVSVNISRNEFQFHDLCGGLISLTSRYQLSPSQLHLEITESICAENTELMSLQIARLRQAGFTVELDDFGAGHSCLNILKDIPVDVLKLDMKFLSGYKDDDDRTRTILSSVIWMARSLNTEVIAEGVETEQQA